MEVVIVTGASSGIGKDISCLLAEKKFEVLACVRKKADVEAWRSYPGVTPLLLDVTKEESVSSALKVASPLLKKAGVVHLVNNAGLAISGPVELVPLDRWREQFEVNVFGLVRVTQVFLPFIRKTSGRIINMSSVSGLVAFPYLGPYAASKFAVEAISDSLRRELRSFGVKVVVVEPGPVNTAIWEKGIKQKDVLKESVDKTAFAVYERELATFLTLVEASARQAVPARKVSSIVLKALKTKQPKARYVVGSVSDGLQAGLLSLLPDHWADSLIAKEFSKVHQSSDLPSR